MSEETPFFSRRIKLFGNVAVLILCCIFFFVPFAFRGARIGLRDMRNEVSDWLPSDFPETKELNWFRDNFLGSQFVVASWDDCNRDDQRFKAMVAKLQSDTYRDDLTGEELRARKLSDELGLHVTESLHDDFGAGGEKWLIGDQDEWYYITRDGGLYHWTGGQNIVGAIGREIERLTSGTNKVEGDLVWQFSPEYGSKLYRFPEKLNSRLFKHVFSGPDVFNQLAGPEGSLIRGTYDPRDPVTQEAQIEAHKRLTGVFFGPTPAVGFNWTANEFFNILPPKTQEALPDAWEEFFVEYVNGIIQNQYGGNRDALLATSPAQNLDHWYRLFYRLQVEPPPRQTCIVAALSDVAARDLSRVVGRPDFFKPVGRVYQVAQQSGVDVTELHLGGPPVDNVAIDEEGTITLVRLVSLSTLIGVILAYISFRSLNVTLMIFFVGGVSAVMSIGFVWFGGSSLDAVLLSMPSLVYVLGLSGAVHIVNYYREACHEDGPKWACITAIKHGWFPCTLAAFTTALGLISLYASNLIPIKKFGLFAAIGTMATVVLLFTYLPSALTLWSPGYKKADKGNANIHSLTLLHRFWDAIGAWIVRHYAVVGIASLIVMFTAAMGIPKIQTSVQLLKLFDGKAKVITDYEWLEKKIGRLVPMELVLAVEPKLLLEQTGVGLPEEGEKTDLLKEQQLTFLERMELSSRVRRVVEEQFGDEGVAIIGPGMSSDVMVLPNELPPYDSGVERTRAIYNQTLLDHREQLLDELDFLRVDNEDQRELWRISLRLGAFNNVDYGRFVANIMQAVEPVLAAYRTRSDILTSIYTREDGTLNPPDDLRKSKILLIGWQDKELTANDVGTAESDETMSVVDAGSLTTDINQTTIFCETLGDLLQNRGFTIGGRGRGRIAFPLTYTNEKHLELLKPESPLQAQLKVFSAAVIISTPPAETMAMLQEAGIPIIRAEEHRLNVDPTTKERLNPTANDLRLTANNPDNNLVTAVYTGIVPIVYKAQRTLLTSLIDSIGLAFAMIAIVMMILLRDWRRRFSLRNSLNVTGGALSMLPNAFPVVMIFGLMGHLAVEVDIGSMMTASVALGVAVDDTIHFLSWFRLGMRQGLSRKESIRSAYAKVATAMTQTTLIAGLGLSAFALSTFTPTQRFGVLMLTLLFAALIGDLIFLPALLASPFGRFLGVKPLPKPSGSPGDKSLDKPPSLDGSASESTSAGRLPSAGKVHFRKDRAHDAENSLKHPD